RRRGPLALPSVRSRARGGISRPAENCGLVFRIGEPQRHSIGGAINDCTFWVCGASIDSVGQMRKIMAQLVVRNLPEDLVRALKLRAAKHNRSAEQEHREILEAALRGPRRRSLAAVLASMPNVGRDEDFARHQLDTRD